jgi:hypothetical protein
VSGPQNFGTDSRCPNRYGLTLTIAWRASPTRTSPPICASALVLNPRWSQGRGASRTFQEIYQDSARLPAKTTWRFVKPRTNFTQGRKTLNLCEKKKNADAATNGPAAQNKFTSWSRLIEAIADFQTNHRRYADKVTTQARFFRSSHTV